jgi:hypothetical protein
MRRLVDCDTRVRSRNSFRYSTTQLTSVAAVLTQEHLTEALRRLRRNTSDVNVDRYAFLRFPFRHTNSPPSRLVTNVLLQFIATPRADPKRFEMLSLLATILSWEDAEREKAGLQRVGGSTTPGGKKGSSARRKDSEVPGPGQGRTQEEQDKYNEVRRGHSRRQIFG